MKYVIPFFILILTSVSVFGQIAADEWYPIHNKNGLKVEIKFNISNEGCDQGRPTTFIYRYNGYLEKSPSFINWKIEFVNCGGKTYEYYDGVSIGGFSIKNELGNAKLEDAIKEEFDSKITSESISLSTFEYNIPSLPKSKRVVKTIEKKQLVKFNITPNNADLYINGKLCQNHYRPKIKAGRNRISIQTYNYKSVDTTIYISPNINYNFSFDLNKKWADLYITAYVAEKHPFEKKLPFIKVDDITNYVTTNRVDYAGLYGGLSPGKHTIEVSLSNYRTQKENINLKAGETKYLNILLEPIKSELIVKTNPPNANVFIEKLNYSGRSPFRKKLFLGEYTIIAKLTKEKQDYISKRNVKIGHNDLNILIDMDNITKKLRPTKFAKKSTFLLFSAALAGGFGAQFYANKKMNEYNNSINSEDAKNLRNEVESFDNYSIIGYSAAAVFLVPYFTFSIKLKKKKKKYGL